jgi:hypothetical protein
MQLKQFKRLQRLLPGITIMSSPTDVIVHRKIRPAAAYIHREAQNKRVNISMQSFLKAATMS